MFKPNQKPEDARALLMWSILVGIPGQRAENRAVKTNGTYSIQCLNENLGAVRKVGDR